MKNKMVKQETFQEFLKKNPDILMVDAFFALFKLYPDATVEDLHKIFKAEIISYVFNIDI